VSDLHSDELLERDPSRAKILDGYVWGDAHQEGEQLRQCGLVRDRIAFRSASLGRTTKTFSNCWCSRRLGENAQPGEGRPLFLQPKCGAGYDRTIGSSTALAFIVTASSWTTPTTAPIAITVTTLRWPHSGGWRRSDRPIVRGSSNYG